MESNRKNVVIGTISGIIAIAIIAWLIAAYGVKGPINTSPGAVEIKGEDVFRPENADALATVESGTREKVKEQIATPEPGDRPADSSVAVPIAISGNGPKLRSFAISGAGGDFSPSKIVVNESDVIEIAFTAKDGDYDLFFPDFGVYKSVGSGQTANIQFQGYPFGQYVFSCRDVCKGAEGVLIINKR
jgi:hypothetical protein